MATIRTAIELYDSFTAPLMNVINAVSAGVSAMESFQATMNDMNRKFKVLILCLNG